jgi:hypothetical protein
VSNFEPENIQLWKKIKMAATVAVVRRMTEKNLQGMMETMPVVLRQKAGCGKRSYL